MINYGLYVQLRMLLSKLSSLTPSLNSTSGTYWQKSVEYLNNLQDFADKYNLYFSSDIALVLSKLLTFSDDKQSLTVVKRNNRKQKDQLAATCLEQVHKEIKEYLEKPRIAFEECSNIWRQLLVLALSKGLVNSLPLGEEKLDYIISVVKSDPELLPYYMHILGLLGILNARAVLDTVLPDLQL